MSRGVYRARGKKVQKLGRDGLVEQDKATGEEHRISQRVADVSFSPDCTPEQAAGRSHAQPQGKKRRQQRPAPPVKPDQPDAVDGLDAPLPAPPMRQAGDVPVSAPPPRADGASKRKHRQQKQANRLNQDAPAPLVADDGGEGRLRFERSPTPSASDAQTRRRLDFADDTSGPEQDGQEAAPADTHVGASASSDPRPPNRGGGRLQFEAERTSAPDGQRPHGGDPVPDAPSTPDGAPSRRQQRRHEKAERRVEQSGRRLEKAQAKLPTKRRAHLEKEYDTNSGKVRRRLRFEEEVLPETAKPSIPAQVGRTAKMAAVMKIHSKIRENERDNTALEAAHKVEFVAERGTGRFLRWNKQRLRSKPYRAVRQAERRLTAEKTKLAWQTALRDNPELRRQGVLAKWMQKQKIKRKYAQAAQKAKKTAQHTQQTITATGKIIRAVQQYAAAHKSALLIVAAVALVISFFSAGLASCTAMLSGVQSSFLSATYLSDEQDICNADLYFTELETDLQLDISATEVTYPGYDEYRYNIGDISHNPYELMSYLSAAYGVFTFEQVRSELDRLFSAKYQLTRTPITETRYDDNDQPYERTVLQTTLTVGRLGDTIAASLTPGEQTDRYNVYMDGYGNRQAYGTPFDFPWLGYVSSGYGWRVHPTTGTKDLHRGVDIAAAQGTPIKAIQDGRVVSAGDTGSYGQCVVVEDGKGYQSRYAHCSSLSVNAGQEVMRGDVIGAVGSTGDSTGPHLHLEVMLNGEYLNPYYFVDTGGSSAAPRPVVPDYSGEPMGGDRFQAMLTEAEKYLGYPYVWGGTNPTTSFDCSGYVSWVINHSGWNHGRLGVMGLEDICTPVSAADAQPGDLVFFIGTYDAPYPNRPTHVGIYVGNGRMIHCGDPISYTSINTTYWQNHFYGFGRLPEP